MNRLQKSALILLTAILFTSMLATLPSIGAQEGTLATPQVTVKAKQTSFEIIILNNQKAPYPNTPVYFDIRMRYNSNENWAETYGGYQSNGDYTVLTYQLDERGRATTSFGGFVFSDRTVQFQVLQSTYTAVGRSAAPPNSYIFAGSNSSWSGTQTCTFSPLPTPTPTPYHPETNPPLITPHPGHQTETPFVTPFNSGSSGGDVSTGQGLDWVQLVTWTLLSVIIALLLIAVFYLRKRSVVNKP
jgi:hypothetical protein